VGRRDRTTFGIQGTGGSAVLSTLQFISPTTGCLVTGNPVREPRPPALDEGRGPDLVSDQVL